MYKIETHSHTKEGSACGYSDGYECARARKEEGYDVVIVTDHFFRGNTRPKRDLPWEQYVEEFCSGYEHEKEEGDRIGLTVLFGWEENFHGAEFLIYGLDKAWLLKHPDMITWTPRQQYEAALSIGLTPAQAVRRVMLPQGLVVALPNLGNSLISLFKEGSLAFTIGLIDMMGSGNLIISRNYGAYSLETYIALAIIYWALTLIIEAVFLWLEKHYSKGRRLLNAA